MIVYWGLNLALYNRKKEKIPAVFPITVPPFWSNSSKDANVILPQEGWPVATALLLSKLRSIVVIIFSIIFQEEFQVLTFVSPLRSMLYIYDYEGRTWKNTFFFTQPRLEPKYINPKTARKSSQKMPLILNKHHYIANIFTKLSKRP